MDDRVGNVLGAPRAEADKLLDSCFLQTADYRALTSTQDFHVVVGRRGTGKSALYKKVREHFVGDKKVVLQAEIVKEHHALSLLRYLEDNAGGYREAHAITRLIWKSYCLRAIAQRLLGHYKVKGSSVETELSELVSSYSSARSCYEYATALLRDIDASPQDVPANVARVSKLDALQELVGDTLERFGLRGVVLLDSLDEGWNPDPVSTALIGGLTRAAADLEDAGSGVHVLAFVRDNMFRALSVLDPDFSRHVEGSDLRLRWDADSLLSLTTNRIRLAFNYSAENKVRVWNRFAARELADRAGFVECLKHTLYRPRDVLALLNRAFQIATRAERQTIVDTDIEAAAELISDERLADLKKEYFQVFPGLRLFVEIFSGTKPIWSYTDLVAFIDSAIDHQDYEEPESKDFAILHSGYEAYLALYSVGFFGVGSAESGEFVFCHDGATIDAEHPSSNTQIAIHPCYWRALKLGDVSEIHIDLLTQIHDEYAVPKDDTVRDRRLLQLGKAVEQLPQLAPGGDHAHKFEEWVERAVKIVFAGDLTNIKLHPQPNGASRRDLVATVCAKDGFWHRILTDYSTRQVVFEIKNYADLKPDDYRQALSYSGSEYGKLVFIVYRPESELVNANERSHLLDIHRPHGVVVVLLPATMLARFVSKMRSGPRRDYWQQRLGRLLDTHIRSHLNIHAGRRDDANNKQRPRRRKRKQETETTG